ncbi:MFS transporter [Zoogloea sp.]|jgi:FSR family fosmidomycin resistance protein-like MFS transporter|uniref:MFS transporter n=1 Tax=Zoogloea sp. TaxID=49181 RepID=UPI0037D99E73
MNRKRLGLLTGTHSVNDLYQGLIPALLPFMVLERGYSYTAVSGLILAATGLSSVVQPLFGLYADKHPRNWLIPAGFMLAALGVALAGVAESYLWTWLAIAISGLGIAAYHPPATTAARLAGGASQKAMSLFSVGGMLGAAAAPLVATAVIGGSSLSATPWLALPAAVMAVVWWGATRHADAAEAALAHARRRASSLATNDWRAFLRLSAVIVGWSIPYVTVLSMVALYTSRDLHGSSAQGALVLTCFTAASAIGTLGGGLLADRVGRIATIRLGYTLALPALAGLVLANAPLPAMLCAALLGTAMFLPFASQVTLAQDYLPRNPATAAGITLGLALSVGGMLSPLLGMLSDSHGLRTTLSLVLGVLTLATALAFQLGNRRIEETALA